MAITPKTALQRARACLKIEGDAIAATAQGLDRRFVNAARAIETAVNDGRKLICSGVGKSAHIAQKLVGTFNSTGVVTCFLDATQALHGDLGLCSAGDVAILFSNSGQTEEVLRLQAMLQRFDVKVIACTAHPESDLAAAADHQLIYEVPREACPLELAPTASTTAALALGDALAMVLLKSRGFTKEDFAKFHPAGNLGRVLLLRVGDIMRQGARLAVAPESISLQDAILQLTKAKSGSIALVNARSGKLTGILTDGDFRRAALTGEGFLKKPVKTFMTRRPMTIARDALGVEALRIFERHRIDDLIVVDEANRPVGLVDGQDLPKLKIV
jgi:arabinose-5-phosphate isomerase